MQAPSVRGIEAAVDGGPASVDREYAAGDEGRGVGGEIDDGPGELRGSGPATERALLRVGVVPGLVRLDLRCKGRFDDARGDRVGAYAARPELGGRRTEDLDEAGFGCRIHRLAGLDRRSADGAEADDAAAPPLRHLLPEGTDQLERRTQVQRHHPVE